MINIGKCNKTIQQVQQEQSVMFKNIEPEALKQFHKSNNNEVLTSNNNNNILETNNLLLRV